jgi:Family of unknown function (DUF6281)
MRWILGAVAIVAIAAGCGDEDTAIQGRGMPGPGPADCDNLVRLQGSIYSGTGHNTEGVTRLGPANHSNCSDTGPDARGPYFPSNPRQVEVWTLDGVPTSTAIGVQYGEHVQVFVPASVTAKRADQLGARLAH